MSNEHYSSNNKNKNHKNTNDNDDGRNDYEPINSNKSTMPDVITSMELEAIFYPKFENESQSSATDGSRCIRSEILDALEEQQNIDEDEDDDNEGSLGVALEVSLKHSGSLVLWSGSDRYYAKNSMDNLFTLTGELLLRKHFERVYPGEEKEFSSDDFIINDSGEGENSSDSSESGNKRKYSQVSSALDKAAFSGVCKGETMYRACSDEVEEKGFCLSFECVTSVLGQHGDVPLRDFLILTAIADMKRESFLTTAKVIAFAQKWRLPHNDVWIFPTKISAESVFLFYDNNREIATASDAVKKLNEIVDNHKSFGCCCIKSMFPHVDFQGEILEGIVVRLVHQSSSKEMNRLSEEAKIISTRVPPSLPSFSVRELFDSIKGDSPRISSKLRTLLRNERKVLTEHDLGVSHEFLSLNVLHNRLDKLDRETSRLAKFIKTVLDMNLHVEFKHHCVKSRDGNDDSIFIVHAKTDAVFPKYYQQKKPDDMDFFRGFSFRVNSTRRRRKKEIMSSPCQETESEGAAKDVLMIKLKFLPYMVRTFIIRNGLSTLRRQGVENFQMFASNLMRKWNITPLAQKKWSNYFHSWAYYASEKQFGTNDYLDYLSEFESKYDWNSSFEQDFESYKFRALVLVVGEDSSCCEFASELASELDSFFLKTSKKLNPDAAARARSVFGKGLVCFCKLTDGVGKVRRLLPKYKDQIFTIFMGCSNDDILKICEGKTQKVKKRAKGMLNSWRKTDFARICDLPLSFLGVIKAEKDGSNNCKFSSLLENLRDFSKNLPNHSNIPGVFVFFPVIPGAGKSTLCVIPQEKTQFVITKSAQHRSFITICSDSTRGKYYTHLRQLKCDDPNSIMIADKNAPPSVWETIQTICTSSRSVPIPVVPDKLALITTKIEGRTKVFEEHANATSVSHFYPFSLHFLAVCLRRVLRRKESTHVGRLDEGTVDCCMVVIKFFSLYRNLTANSLRNKLTNMSELVGNVNALIEVPFFQIESLDTAELPQSLADIISSSLRLQYDIDLLDKISSEKQRVGLKRKLLVLKTEMELSLRNEVMAHEDFIASLTIDENISKDSFIVDLANVVGALDDLSIGSHAGAALGKDQDRYKYVSIDVSKSAIHNLLLSRFCENTHVSIQKLLTLIRSSDTTESPKHHGRLISNTHVTLSHISSSSQKKFREDYSKFEGEVFRVSLKALVLGVDAAAIEVSSLGSIKENPIVPPVDNKFVHITIWCRDNARESNELLEEIEKGKATRFCFNEEEAILGTLTFHK